MQVKQFKSLVEFARKAPVNEQYAKTIRDTALGAVDQAIDTFFQSDREIAQGEQAYNDLTDVQLAFKTLEARTKGQMKSNAAAAKHRTETVELPAPTTVDKTGHTIGDDFICEKLTTEFVNPTLKAPQKPDFDKLGKMDVMMNRVLPLYASVAMVPGPLSVSMKDQIQTLVEYGGRGQAGGGSRQSSEGLSVLGYTTTSSSSSYQANSSQSGFSRSISVDERVMPELHNMKSWIKGLAMTEPVDAKIVATAESKYQGRFCKQESTGLLGLGSKDYWVKGTKSGGRERSTIDTVPYVPSYPNFSGEIQEAKSPMAKAAQAEELGPELLARLQDEGASALAEAVSVLFNPAREVETGRAAYDKLTDLSDALQIVNQRQGGHEERKETGLSQISSAVKELSPLYASVAMVPGEMSSSVKNFAKDIAEFTSKSSSRSSSRSTSNNLSLLGVAENSTSSGSSSSSSTHARSETTTTDERIMTPLHKIKTRLFEMNWDGEKLAAPRYS